MPIKIYFVSSKYLGQSVCITTLLGITQLVPNITFKNTMHEIMSKNIKNIVAYLVMGGSLKILIIILKTERTKFMHCVKLRLSNDFAI